MARLRMGEGILRRKPIEHIEDTEAGEGPRLERSLGLWQLTAIGVGGIIGAGIWQTWVRFAVWFLIGVVIYFGYSYRRSELARVRPGTDA